ncbi:hypothetical protein V5799_007536 [Amblyomma americanum]|uniref:Uncharacterized protein n=1 Tax=Amblyomma americanum TaxID=6943 RepID=A0AAQ4FHB5_AMBAM
MSEVILGVLLIRFALNQETSSSRLHQAGFCMFLVRKCLALTWPILAAQVLLKGKSSVSVLQGIYASLKDTAKLEPYIYERGVPHQYNFGTVGSVMAAGLVEALEASTEGDKNDSWDKSTRAKYNKTVECLVGRHHRQGFGSMVWGAPERAVVVLRWMHDTVTTPPLCTARITTLEM